MDINYAWDIDGKRSDWHYMRVLNEKMEKDDKWQSISLQDDLGVKPILVDAGTPIHILVQSPPGTPQYPCWIGQNGNLDWQRRFVDIFKQEMDFEAHASEYNTSETTQSWGQIPFILYQKA